MSDAMPVASNPKLIDTRQGQMTEKDAKWQASLNIWIDRFRKAQTEIRDLETQLERVEAHRDRLDAVLTEIIAESADEDHDKIAAIIQKYTVRESQPVVPEGTHSLMEHSCGCGDEACSCR